MRDRCRGFTCKVCVVGKGDRQQRAIRTSTSLGSQRRWKQKTVRYVTIAPMSVTPNTSVPQGMGMLLVYCSREGAGGERGGAGGGLGDAGGVDFSR